MNEKEIRASMTSEQIQLERKLTCEAIDGAMAFGYQNTNPPPSDDHWLAPFWKIGRRQAELEERAAPSASIADTATNYVPEDAQIESEARLYSLDLANGLDWCFDDFNLKAFVRALFLQRGEK